MPARRPSRGKATRKVAVVDDVASRSQSPRTGRSKTRSGNRSANPSSTRSSNRVQKPTKKKSTLSLSLSRPRHTGKFISQDTVPDNNDRGDPATSSRDTSPQEEEEDEDVEMIEVGERLRAMKIKAMHMEADKWEAMTRSRSPSRSRSRRHRRKNSDSSLSSDNERERVSFVHLSTGKEALKSINTRFPPVPPKLFKKIFKGSLHASEITKLSTDLNPRGEKDDTEAKSINHLLRCFEIYGQAICHFAQTSVALELQDALADYRIKLSDRLLHYTFESIREHHLRFIQARILTGQDDPLGWRDQARELDHVLIQKTKVSGTTQYKSGQLGYASNPQTGEACRRYNKGHCDGKGCRYTHICSTCHQRGHGAHICTQATGSNSQPLGERVTKP